MKPEGGQQAYDSGRHRPAGKSERVILTDVRACLAIASRAEAFEFAGANHSCECARVNALRSGVAGSQERTLGREAQDTRASGSLMSRHFGYDDQQMLAFCHIGATAMASGSG